MTETGRGDVEGEPGGPRASLRCVRNADPRQGKRLYNLGLAAAVAFVPYAAAQVAFIIWQGSVVTAALIVAVGVAVVLPPIVYFSERSQAKKAFGGLDGLLLVVRVDQATLAAFTVRATVRGAMSERALIEIRKDVVVLKWLAPAPYEQSFEVVEAITTPDGDLPQAIKFDDGEVLPATAPWWAPSARATWRRMLTDVSGGA